MSQADKILLGSGVFSINGIAVALTRGGGEFVIEREIRDIEADGDFGPVRGRQVIDREVPSLTVRGLDIFTPTNLLRHYPGLANATATLTSTLTSTLTIAAGDYVSVSWVGKTKDGKGVTINVTNCLNREDLSWNLEDKNEVVAELVYTGHYVEASRTTPPWSVVFAV